VAWERLRARRKFGTAIAAEEGDDGHHNHDFDEGEAPATCIQFL
jgi:hypothetical protein